MNSLIKSDVFDMFDTFLGLRDPFQGLGRMEDPVRASLEEDTNNYIVRAVVPGYKEDEIECKIEGRQVTLYGKKEKVSEMDDWHSSSRSSFKSRFVLPTNAMTEDLASVNAELKDGILVVKVPKMVPKAEEVKKIPIKTST